MFSDDDKRCVHGGTLIPDLCHFSTDYMLSGSLDLIVLNENGNIRGNDGCDALLPYFEYDRDHIWCGSYLYDHARRRILNEPDMMESDGAEQRMALHFTLMFGNDTVWRQCIEAIKEEKFGRIFSEKLEEHTNVTIVGVAVADLQYDSAEMAMGMKVRGTVVAMICLVLFLCVALFLHPVHVCPNFPNLFSAIQP